MLKKEMIINALTLEFGNWKFPRAREGGGGGAYITLSFFLCLFRSHSPSLYSLPQFLIHTLYPSPPSLPLSLRPSSSLFHSPSVSFPSLLTSQVEALILQSVSLKRDAFKNIQKIRLVNGEKFIIL